MAVDGGNLPCNSYATTRAPHAFEAHFKIVDAACDFSRMANHGD